MSDLDIASRHTTSSWDASGLSELAESNFSTRPMSDNVEVFSQADQSLHHMEISALTAVSYHPSALEDAPSSFAVSEIVNTAIDARELFHHTNAQLAEPRSSSPLGELDMSDSEMTETLDEDGGAPIRPYLMGGDGDMDDIVQQLIHSTAIGQTISTIPEDSEDGNEGNLFQDFEPVMLDTRSSPLSVQIDDDPDNLRAFYPGEQNDGDSDRYGPVQGDHVLSEVDFEDFYHEFNYDFSPQFADLAAPPEGAAHDDHSYFADGEDPTDGDTAAEAHFPASVIHGTTHERNFTIDQFIHQWLAQSSSPPLRDFLPLRTPLPQHDLAGLFGWTMPHQIIRPRNYHKDFYDIQQIPWWEYLRVRRSDARALRDAWYTSYHNLEYSPHRFARRLPTEESYFREKSMYTMHKATIEHFQLRNLMSVVAYNTVEFACESKLYSWMPAYDELTCLIDLSKPGAESCFQNPVKISTMCSRYDVSIAGGFSGEYAMRGAGTDDAGVEGFVTKDFNGITNHIDIIPHRTNRSPVGIFASNDKHLRILDCETNTFVADHVLSRAINCTATASDGRLRVVIGDSPDAWVVEADTGRPVQPLRGHRDFGFACAWSPDMRHIATSNQDKTVIIWDTRTWKPLETIESDVAGYRSLRFSPVGGGPRTLLMCEPADRIAVVNAQTYQTRQVHDFFGEIGGADYSSDGGSIWVANTDRHFGGFMEFDRRQWGQKYGPGGLPTEWLPEAELDEDERCVLSARERQMRFCRNLSDEEYDDLLL